MFSALFSFLGGSVFRMIWGEVSDWVKKRQEHAQEIERIRLESGLEAERHARDLERIRLQHDIGVKEVTVAGDVAVQKLEAEAFVAAMREANRPTGVKWVDAWNGCIRPTAATIVLGIWAASLVARGFVPSQWDLELMGVVLGFYFADRSLGKRGK